MAAHLNGESPGARFDSGQTGRQPVLTNWPRAGFLKVTMAWPERRNSLSFELLAGLDAALDEGERKGARALILTGVERCFCAGAEITYFSDAQSPLAGDPAAIRERYVREIIRIFRRLQAASFVTLAAVNGYALGGGCELALACDLRIASDQARFALPEVKLGVVPAGAGLQQLSRIIGRARAIEMILLGGAVSAAEAAALGLVRSVHGESDLDASALSFLAPLLTASPVAVAAAKQAIYAGECESSAPCDRLALGALDTVLAGRDWLEGMRAFREKRPADFGLADFGD